MPIVRTYACEDCNHMMEVTLSSEQWNDAPPSCPECAQRAMRQEFMPVAIGGSASARAHAIAEDIAAKDYHVADMQDDRKEGLAPKVRYKDQTPPTPSTWGIAAAAMEQAIASGRQTRLDFGSGLDVLQHNLKTGAEPDLIAASKQRAMKVW